MNPQSPAMNNPRVAPIERGAAWLLEGFGYFQKDALTWIGVIVLLFAICVALAFVPFIGSLATNLLMPVFMAGLILGCHAQAQGEQFTVNHLFAGFSKNTEQLIILGVINLLAIIVIIFIVAIIIIVIAVGTGSLADIQSGNPEVIMNNIMLILLAVLIVLALYIPVLMAYWFAPALVVLNDIAPMEALKLSFKACLVNILPFTLYGIVGLVLLIIAAIPMALGFLVLGPMITASIYISYREILAAQ